MKIINTLGNNFTTLTYKQRIMTAEIVTHKNVKGVEKHYLKLKTQFGEHYMTISQLNVDQLKEIEKPAKTEQKKP